MKNRKTWWMGVSAITLLCAALGSMFLLQEKSDIVVTMSAQRETEALPVESAETTQPPRVADPLPPFIEASRLAGRLPTAEEYEKARQENLERIRKEQPPVKKLSAMSPTELATELVTAPSRHEILFMSTFPVDAGLSLYRYVHPGVDELLKRPDAGQALLDVYTSMSDRINTPPTDSIEAGGFSFEFPVAELLLSAPEVVVQFPSNTQRREVISAILDSVRRRAKYNASSAKPLYGEGNKTWAGHAVAQYLGASGVEEYLTWKERKRELDRKMGAPIEMGVNEFEAREILAIAQRFLETQK